MTAACTLLILSSAGIAASSSGFDGYSPVLINNGPNTLHLAGHDVQAFRAWRENYNAHGFDLITFYMKGDGASTDGAWNLLPVFGGAGDALKERYELTVSGGAYLFRSVLWARVGVSQEDTQSLVKWAAKVDPEMRKALHDGYAAQRAQGLPSAQAFARTVQDLADNDNGKLYRAKINSIKISGGAEAEQMATGMRLGGTLAVIEVLNFGCTLLKGDKSVEGRAELTASGFSAISACLLASTKAVTSFAKDGVATLAKLKAVTGYFGGAGAAIGGIIDISKGVESADKGKTVVSTLYFAKGLIGLSAAGANFLTALTNSAPLIAKMAGRQEVVWIGKVKAGIQGATESAEALAKTGSTKIAETAAAGALEEVGAVGGERVFLLLLGRAVLFLGGWEIMVVVTLIQVTIWIFSDNDLQTWLRQCAFGVDAKKDWDAPKQHEAFEKALKSVGLEMKEGAE